MPRARMSHRPRLDPVPVTLHLSPRDALHVAEALRAYSDSLSHRLIAADPSDSRVLRQVQAAVDGAADDLEGITVSRMDPEDLR
jgi:hypothetical protein